MKRAHGRGFGQVIEAASATIPSGLHHLIRPDYFCGADPVFAGLHRFEAASYARSYRNTAHVAYGYHLTHGYRPDRVTTVILPTTPSVPELVHELGHVLDERLGFSVAARPVSWYAKTNRSEAFAEAFTSWLIPGYAARPDGQTVAILDALAYG